MSYYNPVNGEVVYDYYTDPELYLVSNHMKYGNILDIQVEILKDILELFNNGANTVFVKISREEDRNMWQVMIDKGWFNVDFSYFSEYISIRNISEKGKKFLEEQIRISEIQ